MNLITRYFVENNCYKRGDTLTPTGLMLHSTGANNPNLGRYVHGGYPLAINKYNNTWNVAKPDNRNVCVHGFIGRLADNTIATCNTLPWDMRGWHGGGTSNDTHIGVEICEDNLQDSVYFKAVYREALELFAMLCIRYNIPVKNVICHSEGFKMGIASNHADVLHWFTKHNKNMDTFRADLEKLILSDTKALYRIRTEWTNAQSQVGAYNSIENAVRACNAANPYSVYDNNGNKIYPK